MENQDTTASRFSKALRWIGTLSITASALVFLLQGLSVASDFTRFLSFAGLTGGLAALGILAGLRFKENKSARTFLALSAAGAPVLFAQLGAMVYSFAVGTTSSSLPRMLVVTAPDIMSIGIGGGILLLMIPVLYVGFGALYRSQSRTLVMMLLANSVLLLVPSRNADIAALLVTLQAAGLTYFAATTRRNTTGSRETLVAGLLTFIPTAILIGRQCFYASSNYFLAAILGLFAGMFLEILPFLMPNDKRLADSPTFGIISAIGAWFLLVTGVTHDLGILTNLDLLIGAYPAIIAVMLLVPRTPQFHKLHKALYPLALFIPSVSIISAWNFESAVVFIGLGAAAATLGYARRQLWVCQSGALTALIGLAFYIFHCVQFLTTMPWISLAVAGTFAILMAAWLEKNRAQLGSYKQRFDDYFMTKVQGK